MVWSQIWVVSHTPYFLSTWNISKGCGKVKRIGVVFGAEWWEENGGRCFGQHQSRAPQVKTPPTFLIPMAWDPSHLWPSMYVCGNSILNLPASSTCLKRSNETGFNFADKYPLNDIYWPPVCAKPGDGTGRRKKPGHVGGGRYKALPRDKSSEFVNHPESRLCARWLPPMWPTTHALCLRPGCPRS